MCTVVLQREPGARSRILAVRDEFVSRDFDDPDAWWPEHPSYVGGRDERAGGTWCATDVPAGRTAVVLNRRERQTGQPSRGLLPLAALTHGTAWPKHLDHQGMASFTLVLDAPGGVTAWSWDTEDLTRTDLSDGIHLFTSVGIDPLDAKGQRYRSCFTADADWPSVVRAEPRADDLAALIVRHPVGSETYATVLVQSISVLPGDLVIDYTRTPQAPEWTHVEWSVGPDGTLARRGPGRATKP